MLSKSQRTMVSYSLLAILFSACSDTAAAMTALSKRSRLSPVNAAIPLEPYNWSFSSGNSSLSAGHYMFFAHHKTGTALSSQIVDMMSSILGAGHAHILWSDVWLDSVKAPFQTAKFDILCPGGSTATVAVVYEDMRVDFLNKIREACKPMRAVHFIRDLQEALISNYVFTKSLVPGRPGESEPMHIQMRGPVYRNMSLSQGLRVDCAEFLHSHTLPMLEVHEHIKNTNQTDILEVRYEEIEKDYDGTFKSIFEHLLGSNHSKLSTLTEGAKAFDTRRWSDKHISTSTHVSDDAEKAEARREFRKMVHEEDPCAIELMRQRYALGYSFSASG